MMLRIVQHLRGAALLNDLAIHHKHHVIRHLTRKADFMGDNHQRGARARQLFDHVEHLAHQLGVQRRGRLIKQHHAR